ncbi:MAG: hypothetical protein MJ099_00150 [Clostridia bacterium]|nr:hypothetical protein [Clostridia bacterium]
MFRRIFAFILVVLLSVFASAETTFDFPTPDTTEEPAPDSTEAPDFRAMFAENTLLFTMEGDTLPMVLDTEASATYVENDCIYAGFLAADSTSLMECWLILPLDLASGDTFTQADAIAADLWDPGVGLTAMDTGYGSMYAYAMQEDGAAWPKGAAYEYTLDTFEIKDNKLTCSGSFSATLVAVDNDDQPIGNSPASGSFSLTVQLTDKEADKPAPKQDQPEKKSNTPPSILVTPEDAKKI